MKVTAAFLVVLLLALPCAAGVVYEVENKDLTSTPAEISESVISLEGRSMKMSFASGSTRNGEMIFRGDQREMIVVDHDKKSYFVLDEQTLAALSAQINQAMAMMEQALANVPEGQRDQVTKMMKGRMPAQPAPREPSELRRTGDTESINNYPCVRYELWRGGVKIREMWVTDWSNVEGGAEAAELFQEMSGFFKEMLDSLPKFGDGQQDFADPVFEHMQEMDGFPIVTREIGDNGTIENEASLQSSKQQNLDPVDFEPPKGYKRQEMFKGK